MIDMRITTEIIFVLFLILTVWLLVLRSRRRDLKNIQYISIVFFVMTVIILVDNFDVITHPFTHRLTGRVIDAETRRPLANVDIKAYWDLYYVFYGAGSRTYKTEVTKTDRDGYFTIPPALKRLSIGYGPARRTFRSMGVLVYSQDYKFSLAAGYGGVNNIEISLKRITSDKEYLENIEALIERFRWTSLHAYEPKDEYTPREISFVRDLYKTFPDKYPGSKLTADCVRGSDFFDYLVNKRTSNNN